MHAGLLSRRRIATAAAVANAVYNAIGVRDARTANDAGRNTGGARPHSSQELTTRWLPMPLSLQSIGLSRGLLAQARNPRV